MDFQLKMKVKFSFFFESFVLAKNCLIELILRLFKGLIQKTYHTY